MTRRRMQLVLGVMVAFALAATSLALANGGHDGKRGKGKGSTSAQLTGYEETPASINSPGKGTFRAELSADKITYRLEFSGLSTPATMAHVHIGRPAQAGGIAFFLCGGGTKPACPAGGGTVTGTVVASDILGPTAQGFNAGDLASVLAAIKAGAAYANVHTTKWPNGEIRGQLRGGHGDDDNDDDDD